MTLLQRLTTSPKSLAAERQQAEELRRYAEFGRISAQLLHEVSVPLTAASLNLEQFDGRQLELVRLARKNLLQLERYIQAARRQLTCDCQPVRFSVRCELRQLALMMQPVARQRRVQLIIETACSGQLYGDPARFSQLVTNLIVNAIDAYDGLSTTRKLVRVSATAEAESLLIRVSDHGVGINSSVQEQLFKPFCSTKHDRRYNLGIGLNTVRQITEQEFGGSISVESAEKSGACFTVKLPLLRHAAAAARQVNNSIVGLTAMLVAGLMCL